MKNADRLNQWSTAMSRILIAGAGIGGLTAALALLRDGHEVQLYEQATELREVGAGVQLSANGTRVLIALGLRPAMERIVCEPAGKEIRLWSTGQSWKLFDLGESSVARYGAPYWMVHRGDFHAALRDAVRQAAPDAIRTFDRIRTALQACVDSGTSTSADPHADAFLVWVGMHGMATLEKPRRADLRQLGPLDRVALTESLARRLAGLQ